MEKIKTEKTSSHNRGPPQQFACDWIRSKKFLTIGYHLFNRVQTLYIYIFIYIYIYIYIYYKNTAVVPACHAQFCLETSDLSYGRLGEETFCVVVLCAMVFSVGVSCQSWQRSSWCSRACSLGPMHHITWCAETEGAEPLHGRFGMYPGGEDPWCVDNFLSTEFTIEPNTFLPTLPYSLSFSGACILWFCWRHVNHNFQKWLETAQPG